MAMHTKIIAYNLEGKYVWMDMVFWLIDNLQNYFASIIFFFMGLKYIRLYQQTVYNIFLVRYESEWLCQFKSARP